MADHPDDLRYSEDHEWVRTGDTQTLRVGITSYAAEQLGDIVYVSLPEVGQELVKGETCGELESTKSVSDVISPVNGVVSAVNSELVDGDPGVINSDPYGSWWLCEVTPADDQPLAGLMDAAGYADHIG